LGRELTLIWAEIWQTLRRTLLKLGIKLCRNLIEKVAEMLEIHKQNFGRTLGRKIMDI
jgi:hypothetical protein